MPQNKGLQRELLYEFRHSPAWADYLLPRLQAMHQSKLKELRAHLHQDQKSKADIALGWVEAVEWMADLPKLMTRELSEPTQE